MNTVSVESLIDLITNAVQFKFASDPTSPGLLISKLKNGDTYVSVVRFKTAFGKDKMVEFKAREVTMQKALEEIAKQIVSTDAVKDPIDDLRSKLGV